MTEVSPSDLASVYLQGWSPAMLAAYSSAYRDIIRYGEVLGRHWYYWGLGEVSSYLINGSKHLPNSIKKFSVVLVLLFYCCDRTSPAVGPLVLKNVAIAKKAPRPLWMPDNLLMFVTALVVAERNFFDLIIMALQLLCYLTMRRFKDFQNVRVGDIRVLANGDLRLFQKIGKTFQMGQGTNLHVLNKPFRVSL